MTILMHYFQYFNNDIFIEMNGVKDEIKANIPKSKDDAKSDEGQQPKETQKPQDKSRPVSSTPISGTPWFVFNS